MAHIVSCILEGETETFDLSLNNYLAKPTTPQPPNDSVRPACKHLNQLLPTNPLPSPLSGLSPPRSLPCVGSQAYAPSLAHPPQPTDKASTTQGSEKPFAWRMHQPGGKYQLFPKDRQPASASGKTLDPEQAFALAMGQNGEKSEKSSTGSALRIRIKEHNLSLIHI